MAYIGTGALDICLVDYSTPEPMLVATLRSLARALALQTLDIKVYLIDNGNRRDLLQSILAGISTLPAEIVSGHGNIGFGAGNNLAIRRARKSFFLLLNPDVELFPDALAFGLAFMAATPDAVAVAPAVTDSEGKPAFLCRNYPSLRALIGRALGVRAFQSAVENYELRLRDWSIERDDFQVASGCFLLIRTEALQAVNGFDERYFLYFEDYDLSLRLREHGRIVYLPEMRIRHHGGDVARKSWRHKWYFLRSMFLFFNRHGWRW